MNNTTSNTPRLAPLATPAPLTTIIQALPYLDDPTHVFHALCQMDDNDPIMAATRSTNKLLLESADIDSKLNLKSLLLMDSAVRIECRGNTITYAAMTKNGMALLDIIEQTIPHYFSDPEFVQFERTIHSLVLTISTPQDETLDEDSRLRQVSSFDALRLIQSAFDISQEELDQHALLIGGLFAYDLVGNFEDLSLEYSSDLEDPLNCPDYVFYVMETLLVFDHHAQTCQLQATLFLDDESLKQQSLQRLAQIEKTCQQLPKFPPAEVVENAAEAQLNVDQSDTEFCQTVDDLKKRIVQGDIFQVVPSRCFSLPCPSPLHAYKALKQSNPSPYMFYMKDQAFTLFGASPESALKYDTKSNQVEIYPIAGTRRRGKRADGSIDFDLDSRIELELRKDEKENAEHMMLVDLARNDVARISEAGTRHVADLLKVDRYSHVIHLVSRVVGQLRHDLDALHAYQATMNMGTLTGAPKIKAMQLIRSVEKKRRGSYGGAVGYITGTGDLDTCIVIRSAYVKDNVAYVQAGAGVVLDSDPQSEADETRTKAQACINAIQQAHQGQISASTITQGAN